MQETHSIDSPPIASPTENWPHQYNPTTPRQPGRIATAFGHFLWSGFLGQVAFTVSLFFIPNERRGAINHTPLTGYQWVFLFMCLSVVCAFSGMALSFLKPRRDLGDLLRMVLTFFAIGALGVLDVFGLIIWDWHGYC